MIEIVIVIYYYVMTRFYRYGLGLGIVLGIAWYCQLGTQVRKLFVPVEQGMTQLSVFSVMYECL